MKRQKIQKKKEKKIKRKRDKKKKENRKEKELRKRLDEIDDSPRTTRWPKFQTKSSISAHVLDTSSYIATTHITFLTVGSTT